MFLGIYKYLYYPMIKQNMSPMASERNVHFFHLTTRNIVPYTHFIFTQ